MTRLTDAALRSALKKPPRERRDLPDGTVPGLMLRLGPDCATWSLKFRVVGEGGVSKRGHQKAGGQHRISLGEYPTVTLEAARARANSYLDQAKRGVSPISALESSATAGGLTVAALADKFIDDYVRMKEIRALFKYEGALRVHIVPRIGNVLADVLTRQQVRDLIKAVITKVPRGDGPKDRPRGGREAARSTLGVLRKMFNWARDENLVVRKDNPAAGLESNLPKKRQGERVLSVDEARAAWRAAESLGYPFGPVYQLILLTGCRPGEWASCRRSYIDLKQGLLVIPADAYKADHVHVVPLVAGAVGILHEVLEEHRGASGDYLFSGTDGRSPLAGWTKGHARMLRTVCSVTGERVVNPWTPHDLRRTVATRIAERLGVGGEQLIKRVLGHSDGSVTAVYNRYGYVKEMRDVLDQWSRELTRPGTAEAQLVSSAA